MKIIGIIAEYNPFHNGHAYQIETIRRQTGADYIVAAMSGDFVQRGAPALIDKYARTSMALSCGVDLVLELPALWATASAEAFAGAGVMLFEKMGCVDGICFGAESDNLPLLLQIADLLAQEPAAYRNALSSYLKEGISFPAARGKAVCDCLAENVRPETIKELEVLLREPNNILATEYLKALRRHHSSLTPYLIRRKGAGYHEDAVRTAPSADHTAPTASATAIRNLLTAEGVDPNAIHHLSADNTTAYAALAASMPQTALATLTDYLSHSPFLTENDFSAALGYLLLTATKEHLMATGDCNGEIANRLLKNQHQFSSFAEFCTLNKSRDVTYTRIQRILIHLLLNIGNDDYRMGKSLGYIPYLRILGFRRDATGLLSSLKKSAAVPVIAKLADAAALLSPDAHAVLQKDVFAADLYEQTLSLKKSKTTPRSEYTRGIVLI